MELLHLLQGNPAFLIAVVALFGLMVGSFLNVVAYRLPLMMQRSWEAQCAELQGTEPTPDREERFDLVHPRSRCPACGHAIRARENIPVLSYLWLKGRCAACGTRIPARYPLVELATALLSATVAWHFGWSWQLPAALFLTWTLVPLTLIDYDAQLLPDSLTQPLLWAGLLLSLGDLFVDSRTAILGAAAGYLILWAVYQGFRILTGKEGMGYGDFKLLAALGAWMGWQALPLIILLSSVVGAVVGGLLIAFRGRDRAQPIPFGPFLAAAGWIALMWGDRLTRAYLDFAGIP